MKLTDIRPITNAFPFPLVLKGNWVAPIFTFIASLFLFAFVVGAIEFGIRNPIETGFFYPILMGILAIFAFLAGALFLYLLFWNYPYRTIFTSCTMTQYYFLRTVEQPMDGIVSFTMDSETRLVRSVERKLYQIVFHYDSGDTFRWIPHEFDFPINYIDATTAATATRWLQHLRAAYL
ncbi:MAG: hypothetical protein AAF614_33865 [Chloroflexota bacterium]